MNPVEEAVAYLRSKLDPIDANIAKLKEEFKAETANREAAFHSKLAELEAEKAPLQTGLEAMTGAKPRAKTKARTRARPKAKAKTESQHDCLKAHKVLSICIPLVRASPGIGEDSLYAHVEQHAVGKLGASRIGLKLNFDRCLKGTSLRVDSQRRVWLAGDSEAAKASEIDSTRAVAARLPVDSSAGTAQSD